MILNQSFLGKFQLKIAQTHWHFFSVKLVWQSHKQLWFLVQSSVKLFDTVFYRWKKALPTFWQTLKIPASVQQKAESLTLKRYDNLTTNKSYWWLQIVQFITQNCFKFKIPKAFKMVWRYVLSFQKYGRLRCLLFCQRFSDFCLLGLILQLYTNQKLDNLYGTKVWTS